ncbi:MAG TPA: patatin family protein [Clostridiales bacterium]|nr:patatin family protein [Clostridiales bacterium]
MKTGLILEGGAMRGMFTAGVIDVMMEHQIAFDGAIGVSAGAVFGCNYKSGQAGRAIRYNVRFCRDPRYASFRSLLRTGDLYGAEFCYHELPRRLDVFDVDAFRSSDMEFYAVCTDVATGRPVYHKCETGDETDIQWFRASASMPLVSRIVEVDGYRLLDGGISDPIPVRKFEAMGYDRNVIVLTQPLGYRKKKNRMLPLLRAAMRNYPQVIRALERRHSMYNETTAYVHKLEQTGKALVIRPKQPLNIAQVEHNPKELQRVYALGRAGAEERLEEIRRFLTK